MRVLVVDDHPVVRFGLVGLLSRDFEVIEAATGEESVTRASTVDVVLMDLQLGKGIDGVEATRRIRALENPPQVVVLTTYDSDADIVRAVEAGAIGYLLKDCGPEDLAKAVRTALTGQTVLSPDIAQRLLRQVRGPAPKLSKREVQILEHLARGLSNREIAKELFISEATVKTHLVRIFVKLGVDTRTAAVTTAVERKLIRL
ncbi:two component transcriptional regulator, LuxR family [Lentzea albidocapillata subsp. violacea]|uniref:Two component transcriptional regulator, LuxR family n=1 Tax=Lentzea albidocapillata subsp. violacea TaxID=128104 RepID=A0A1G9QQT2_9PSEU|nr:response regulator transcription factor [Lentzea albidocapillata]SDM13201.1 two component transcriptional regulator, LuxR family [Lentzea albidocapillata subsp. violacea]